MMQSQLYWQIHKIAFLLEKQADEMLKNQLSIGFAQYKVLEAINQNALAKQNVIAELLDQTEASISRQAKLLQKAGAIEIAVVMGNKRARELSLTLVGEEMVRQAQLIVDEVASDTYRSLTFQEQRLLTELLDKPLRILRGDDQES